MCEQDCEFIVPGHSFVCVGGGGVQVYTQSKDGVDPLGIDDTNNLRLHNYMQWAGLCYTPDNLQL